MPVVVVAAAVIGASVGALLSTLLSALLSTLLSIFPSIVDTIVDTLVDTIVETIGFVNHSFHFPSITDPEEVEVNATVLLTFFRVPLVSIP